MAYTVVKHLLGVFVSFVLVSCVEGGRTPEDVIFPLLCQQSIGPGQGILINQSVLVTDNGLDIDKKCNITLATKRKDDAQRVSINIERESCANGSIEIFDYKTQESITGDLCELNQNRSIFQSHSRVLSLVVTPDFNTSLEAVFKILFTSFNMGKDGKCTEEEFRCTNKTMCIAKDLYCNGYYECSDGSDEPATCGFTVTDNSVQVSVYVIGGLVTLVIVVALAGAIFFVCRKMKRRRRSTAAYSNF